MRCYQHQDVEAVGVCGSCLKGVCPACATQMERGSLACSDACAERIQENEQWTAKIKSAKSQHRFNIWLAPAIYVGMGVLFLVFGIHRDGYTLGFATTMGALFVIYGAIYGWRMRKWSRQQLS